MSTKCTTLSSTNRTLDDAAGPCCTNGSGRTKDRLRQAREEAGFKTASSGRKRTVGRGPLARISTSATRTATERSHDGRPEYANSCRVTAGWILYGSPRERRVLLPATGTTGPDPVVYTPVKVMGQIGAGAEIEPGIRPGPPDGFSEIDVPSHSPGNDRPRSCRQSMVPRYDDRDVIVVWAEQRRPTEALSAKR